MATHKRGKTFHADVTLEGVRYRESLKTTDWKEAGRREKELVTRISAGRAAGPAGRGSFARLPLEDALLKLRDEREESGNFAAKTLQMDRDRSRPLTRILGGTPLRQFTGDTIRDYQAKRRAEGVSGRTVNIELVMLRLVLKRAKRWASLADDVKRDKEGTKRVGRVLTPEEKLRLFQAAASKPEWEVAYRAAVVAVNTTCRKIELLSLRWRDVDLLNRVLSIRRSKTDAGYRDLPLNEEAMSAFGQLRQRAEVFSADGPDSYVFPACENGAMDFTRPQKTFRTAWRSLTRHAALKGFRFHDLRHQSITEMAEAGVPMAAMQSMAGHMSAEMVKHYTNVRLDAKREAVAVLGTGLNPKENERERASQTVQ